MKNRVLEAFMKIDRVLVPMITMTLINAALFVFMVVWKDKPNTGGSIAKSDTTNVLSFSGTLDDTSELVTSEFVAKAAPCDATSVPSVTIGQKYIFPRHAYAPICCGDDSLVIPDITRTILSIYDGNCAIVWTECGGLAQTEKYPIDLIKKFGTLKR